MSEEGRHLWVHKQVWSTRSIPKEALTMKTFDACAICRGLLKTCCMDCLSQFDPINAITECKRYWEWILLARNRRESYIFQFSLAIISEIYKALLKTAVWLTYCPLQKPIACNHVYHADCFNKWRAKRNNCPLDQIECVAVVSYTEDPYIHHQMGLAYFTPYKTNKLWEDIQREQELKANRPAAVNATAISIIKKRCPDYMERDEIHTEVRKKPHLDALEDYQIDAALDNLTTREFLEHDEKRDSYKYLP